MAKQPRVWDGSQWQELAVQVPDMSNYAYLPTTPVSGFRNSIINGNMLIWQRGTSSTGSGATAFTADRWNQFRGLGASGITVSRQSASLTGFQYCARVQRDSGNTGTAAFYFVQNFESVTSIPYAGKTVTLSFYARAGANYSAASSILRATIETQTGAESFYYNIGDGAATTLIATNNAVLTTSWTRYTLTATVPSNATQIFTAFKFIPVGTAGANDYFEVTGVQLEEGSVATPFERRFIGTELDLCRRYFQLLGGARGVATSSTDVLLTLPLNPPMRVSPVVLATGPLNAQADGFGTSSTQSSFTKGFELNNPDSLYVTITGFSGLSQGRTYTSATPQNNGNNLTLNAEL